MIKAIAVAASLCVACAHSGRGKVEFSPVARWVPSSVMLATPEGKEVKFADYCSKLTVISLWATWCQPCMQELPYIDELYRSYQGDKDVAILAIHTDLQPTSVARTWEIGGAIKKLGLTLPMLIDELFALRNLFPTKAGRDFLAVPMFVIVDAEGRVVRLPGFDPRQTKKAFVTNRRMLIELARARASTKPSPPP